MRDYAADLIHAHAYEVEFLSIFEMAEEYGVDEPTEDEASKILKLINEADVEVSWEEQ